MWSHMFELIWIIHEFDDLIWVEFEFGKSYLSW